MENSIFETIKNSRYCLIVTHINPDADTISCALALSSYMDENKIKHKVFNESSDLPSNLDFLPRFDKITDQVPKFYDLAVFVDCAVEDRVGLEVQKGVKIINIDHHQSNSFFGNINIVDDSKASTAELLYEVFEKESIPVSKNAAMCLYVGIYDDSIAFTTPRVDSRTFQIVNKLAQTGIDVGYISDNLLRRDSLSRYRIMPKILDTLQLRFEGKVATVYLENQWLDETGAKVRECDDVVNMVLNIAVVQLVCYFRTVNGKVRVSLRSKGDLNVSKIAENFNGGGHKNAAGLTMQTDNIVEAKKMLLETIQSCI
jgi:phosphoesterase RecJ-like protein